MSEIRVDKIEPIISGGSITFTGITTFSGTGSVTFPSGTITQKPSIPVQGDIRVLQGDLTNAIEYYNGISWAQV